MAEAAGPRHEVHQFRVGGHVERGLAHPVDPHPDEGVAELLQRLAVGGDVVVDEEDQPPALRLDLGERLVDPADVMLAAEVFRDRAEIADEAAAAGVLHERERQVALALVDVAPCQHAGLRQARRAGIARLQRALAGVRDHLRPNRLGVADHQRVGVGCAFLRHEGGLEPAHHHLDAAATVLGGDLVGAARGVGLDGDADEVGGLGVGDRLAAVVIHHHFDVGRSEGRENPEVERLHPAFVNIEAVLGPADGGLDEGEFHSAASGRAVSGASEDRARACLRAISRRDRTLASSISPVLRAPQGRRPRAARDRIAPGA